MSADPSPTSEKPRWQYRLDNFARAYFLLREGVDKLADEGLSQLEQEGLIQRFEYTWELAWKSMADYLAYQGIVVTPVTPRAVLKAAFKADLIADGDAWMVALDARNKMSHTYNFKVFGEVIGQVRDAFLDLFGELYERLTTEAVR